jgi:phosphonate transport system ATP-binding protein
MNDILRLNDIHYVAGKREILKGLSMTVKAGSAATIMGPNGAGKTTLLKVALGLLKPSAGEVTFFGEKKLSKESRKNLGYIPQNLALVNELDVLSNIMMGAARRMSAWRALVNSYAPDILEEAEETMNMLGISHLAHTKVKKLSGGERQRVAIARTLLQRPSIIVADEMMSSLDFKTSLSVVDTLIDVKKKMGLTLLMTHHNPDIAKICSDMIYIIRYGAMFKEVPAAEIDRESLMALYESTTSSQ